MSGAASATAITAGTASAATAAAVAAGSVGAEAVAAGTLLPSLSTLGAIGSGLSALSSIAGGRQASESAKYNASVQANNAELQKQNATLAGQEGAANAAIEQQKTRSNVGAIKAAQAANGVNVNTGSAVDVRSSAAELGELNAITIRSNAAKQAYGYQNAAASDKATSELDKQEAGYDSTAGFVNAGTTLLGKSTAGSQSGLWSNYLNSGALS